MQRLNLALEEQVKELEASGRAHTISLSVADWTGHASPATVTVSPTPPRSVRAPGPKAGPVALKRAPVMVSRVPGRATAGDTPATTGDANARR